MGKLTAVAVKAALTNPGTYQGGEGLFLKVDKRGGAYWLPRLHAENGMQDATSSRHTICRGFWDFCGSNDRKQSHLSTLPQSAGDGTMRPIIGLEKKDHRRYFIAPGAPIH